MSIAFRLLHKNCSDTVVGLELLVCLSIGLRLVPLELVQSNRDNVRKAIAA